MEVRLALDDVDQFGAHVKLKKECLFLETHSCIHFKSKLSLVLCYTGSKCTFTLPHYNYCLVVV